MKAMLNIMAHEYHRVDLRIVWETAQKIYQYLSRKSQPQIH